MVALLLAWTAWTAWSAARDLRQVERDAIVLRAELEDGDAAGAARALERYQESAGSARSRTDGPTWWVIEHVPGIGDEAAAVATAAAVLDDLGQDGIPPLVEAAELVAARSFNPTNYSFPLETIASVTGPAKDSEEAFDDAAARLDTVDDLALTGPVGERYRELRDIVLTARATLGSAYRAAELMPSLLGADGPRDHLLVFENNAELRSLGGLAGSISRIHADGGRVEIEEQEGTSKYGGLENPVIRLTPGERAVFGDALGQYFMNASMSPDVPRAAVLARTRWERELGGDIDGVFFVDPVAVSYLLSATGPVDVPGYGSVSAADVVSKVENQIYLTAPDRAAQEDYQNAVAEAVFNAFAAGRGEPVEVIRMLATAVAEGRVRMHSFVEDEQEQIAGTEIAGELRPTDDEAQVGIYLNDALESKMTYYLAYEADVIARACTGYKQEIAGTFRLTSTVPPGIDLPPTVTGIFPGGRFFGEIEPGQQRLAVYVMAPPGGTIEELSLEGRRFDPVVTDEYAGREVAQIVTILDPGETQRIEFELRTGPGQTGPVELDVTPGAFPGSSARELRSAC
ncbi:DUF4012 domain-containing protein [Nocardioides stalactiti]|uniref:DUF4012 domain-containing protein n=1 Tax=Nocardioides stalactiti TaxID=2755356 RepID=UPI0016046333|nr:DUF4012 domain-containing protein [Nocardioides stalactiti]